MKKDLNNPSISIETSFAGGSLSLSVGDREIDFWIGQGGKSRSKDILEALDLLLKKNGIGRESLETVFISRGPGSYTAIRIGLALGLGLSKGLDCRCFGVSIFEALRLIKLPEKVDSEIIWVLVSSQKKIFWQIASDNDLTINNELTIKNGNKIHTSGLEQFLEEQADNLMNILFYVNPAIDNSVKNIFEEMEKRTGRERTLYLCEDLNLAKYIGQAGRIFLKAAAEETKCLNCEPIYL